MTLPLEHVQDGDWAALNRVVDMLRSLVLDTGGRSLGIRVGTATVTFAGASPNGQQTVTHGLGKTPVGFSAILTGADDVIPIIQGGTMTSTTFVLVASSKTGVNIAAGQQRTFYWIVLG
jgi:hypothetical protein